LTMNKKLAIFFTIFILVFAVYAAFRLLPVRIFSISNLSNQNSPNFGGPAGENPLSIEYMRAQSANWRTGSDIKIEETLEPGSNYDRYVVSYQSEGLKIYALLTVPQGEKPKNGWPVIIFNHGYIPPEQYRTTERYAAYTDAFSANGYIVFKSDYRGHGNSEGSPEGAYYSPAYTTDVLNAVASIKKFKDANPSRIGMWGHSMGGTITLRSMVVSEDIKAGVIWAGVVADYQDLTNNWHHPDIGLSPRPFVPSQREQATRRPGRQALVQKYGDFERNPTFWNSIAPINFVRDISGPIELHHGTADEEVPLLFSQKLDEAMKKAGRTVEFYTYEGDDHNISQNLTLALQRSVDFFDKYLKN